MKMNQREMELFVIATKLAADYDRCNPDVGMGPSLVTLAKRVASRLTGVVDQSDIATCVHILSKQGIDK